MVESETLELILMDKNLEVTLTGPLILQAELRRQPELEVWLESVDFTEKT
jgi:hypothetical protein